MPDASRFVARLERYRHRLRLSQWLWSVVAAAAAAALLAVVLPLTGATTTTVRVAALAMFVLAALAGGAWAWRRWTLMRTARALEGSVQDLDNLVVTAEEVAAGRLAVASATLRAHVFDSAAERLEALPLARVRTRAAAVWAILSLVVLTAIVVRPPVSAERPRAGMATPVANTGTSDARAGDLTVMVTPPAYSGRPRVELRNPSTLTVLEGSRLRLEMVDPAPPVTLVTMDTPAAPFLHEDGRAALEITAHASQPLIIRSGASGPSASDRLVQLRVDPDRPPAVRITAPGKDLIFPVSAGTVPVAIAAEDDVALAGLALRYTQVTGSGETFTFTEGEWPIAIARSDAGTWTATATLDLATLGLDEGDTLVYRAVARDGRPGADPVQSDAFLIEIGQAGAAASSGFALPDDQDRQAISQQMLIIKTERLHAERGRLPQEAFVEQSRLLAIEQRMVKAEFVFMTGGEVADEIEEATHSHELAEGRMENTGQAELLTAIREMSRAEARLNDGDTAGGLAFERAALEALQRAFDRRRYFLRTLPERARIDLARRLSGELPPPRTAEIDAVPPEAPPGVAAARDLLRELPEVIGDPTRGATIAARMLALDGASAPLAAAAVALAAAEGGSTREAAVRDAQAALVLWLGQRMAPARDLAVLQSSLDGRLADEMRKSGGRPR